MTFEWFSKILDDTKYHVVSLRQLGFSLVMCGKLQFGLHSVCWKLNCPKIWNLFRWFPIKTACNAHRISDGMLLPFSRCRRWGAVRTMCNTV